jgi:hypothetical protein
VTEAERRRAVELYLSRFSDSDDGQYGSYAWIWREASRILEEEDA